MEQNKTYDPVSSEQWRNYEYKASLHCEPLYLMPDHGTAQHSADNESASVTYVKLDGQAYAITAAHVAEAREQIGSEESEDWRALIPTVWGLSSGRPFSFRPSNFYRLAGEFKFPSKKVNGRRELDIAIAKLSPEFIDVHMRQKGKVPLELNAWEAPALEDPPDLANMRSCATWGWPNRSKTQSRLVVTAKLLTCNLDLRSNGRWWEQKQFSAGSTIPDTDRHTMSGVSGSVAYCLLKSSNIMPIGLVYEGAPGDPSADMAAGSFFGPDDYHFMAYVLTPDKMREWIKAAKIDVASQT
jgi:hypothetical protein